MSRKPEVKSDIPDFLHDPATGRKYRKGKFLGRVSSLVIGIHPEQLATIY